ncbi:MAG: thioredoxin [Candidatus Kapabacteria bacterium]|nr:thioredoxin [Candidatus Kapabacteria bacterium]
MNILIIITLGLIIAFIIFRMIAINKLKSMPATPENNKIINLTEQNFYSVTKNGVSLIDFWAEWCAPCKMMTPILNSVAEEANSGIRICKLNVDSEKKLASKFSVRGIPTLILMKNGKEINRFVGVKQKDFLLKQLNLIK